MPSDTNPDAVKEQQVKAIASEIKSLRGWLDYLERDNQSANPAPS